MNDYTKGKWEVSKKLPYIIATTAPPYRLRGNVVVSRGQETGGQDWPALEQAEYEANARRICQCVNSHDDLLAACKMLIRAVERGNFDKNGFLTIHPKSPFIETFEQVIAKAVPTSQVKEIEK